ncbi:MAG TPA: nickel pincer cofactor biosynthesis protein LarC [Candidatus Eremiobacteraceae bacterium]
MRIACFDCFAGASGNMILGALVDAGLSMDALQRELRRLPVEGWTMRAESVSKRGVGALYLDVDVPGEDHLAGAGGHGAHAHRKLANVLAIVRAAGFPAAVEKTACAIYHRLGEAEARVHRVPIDEIAFHEVGQIDAIVDIAGAALGLFMLDIDRVYCSRLPCGRGSVHAGHGTLPSPPPATMELLRGFPCYEIDVDGELVTPTGAAILTTVSQFGLRPPMTVRGIGYGSGRSEFPFANVLRVVIGDVLAEDAIGASGADGAGDIEQIETNIDDMNPQIYEHLFERMFAAGAVDVWTEAALMKKGRPGTVVRALAPLERADAVVAVMLAETTSIGVRRWTARRTIGVRAVEQINSDMGSFRVKITQTPAGPRARPEYEDVRAIARRDGAALVDVMRRAERIADEWLAGKARR